MDVPTLLQTPGDVVLVRRRRVRTRTEWPLREQRPDHYTRDSVLRGVAALTDALRHDADLACQFLCKVTHELTGALRHTVIVTRRDALGRVTMFLRMLEQDSRHSQNSKIEVPVSRLDVANYLGLSLEAVSRALSRLERDGIIAFEGRRRLLVVDRTRFERIAAAL
jgi:CRP-like cAMP-binding protein